MNSYRVIKYLVEGDTGMSSRAIISQYIDKTHNDNISHPHDYGDLRRCIQAVESLGLNNVDHMKVVSKAWRRIANRWEDLNMAYNVGDKEECWKILIDILP